MHELIPTVPEHGTIDSTKLSCYQECPRKFFYNYILGWRSVVPSYHLHAGASFHVAMEHLLWSLHRDGYYKAEAAREAYELFLLEYRKHFSEVDDHLRAPKDPASIQWALDEYIKYYQTDRFEVLHTEVAGRVPIAADHWIWFNIDALIRDKWDKGLKAIDHKTTKSFDRNWQTAWRLTIQFGTYSHAMRCIYGDDFWGVIVNGVALSTPPKLKKDGTPYANQLDKGPKFLRANIRHTPDSLEGWYFDALHQYTGMLHDCERLVDCKEGDRVMRAFPRNYSSCKSYGGCPFLFYCDAWNNPLQYCDEPPIDYAVDHWNPADRLKNAKTLVTFTEDGQAKLEEVKDGTTNTKNG